MSGKRRSSPTNPTQTPLAAILALFLILQYFNQSSAVWSRPTLKTSAQGGRCRHANPPSPPQTTPVWNLHRKVREKTASPSTLGAADKTNNQPWWLVGGVQKHQKLLFHVLSNGGAHTLQNNQDRRRDHRRHARASQEQPRNKTTPARRVVGQKVARSAKQSRAVMRPLSARIRFSNKCCFRPNSQVALLYHQFHSCFFRRRRTNHEGSPPPLEFQRFKRHPASVAILPGTNSQARTYFQRTNHACLRPVPKQSQPAKQTVSQVGRRPLTATWKND